MNNSFNGSFSDGVHESVSIAVVAAVATHRGMDPTRLPPFYEWIDPDALDSLFAPTQGGGPLSGRLEFTYDGHAVTVDCTDGGSISVDGSLVAESVPVGPGNTAQTDA
ncbi:HalOD1 output domain-containing protein [Natrinema sp. SYSU A 869]|uniref:HalOD1 output domain-containing protein n=1 Tax=Natrinema sp. SYSU A 869 TaxID=2871694 RepID=UPI002106EE81|nr:HalOD1 output domain-containing protein [Natrinema sp. SYSU A 869]